MLSLDKIIAADSYNIHLDAESKSLNSGCILFLDSLGFSENVNEPTQHCDHTLEIVPTYGIEMEHLTVFSINPLLYDHNI